MNYTNEDNALVKIFTYTTAPTNKKHKWRFYFGNLPKEKCNHIRMDEESLWSVTDWKTANNISNIILGLPEVNIHDHIVDGTACAGGNTISFVHKGFKVTAIENNEDRFKHILMHNLKLYRKEEEVTTICGDFLEIYPTLSNVKVFFLDPPWGGTEYKNHPSVQLFLSDKSIAKICSELSSYTKYVVFKVPINFNMSSFLEEIRYNNHSNLRVQNTISMKLYRTYKFKKMKLIIMKSIL